MGGKTEGLVSLETGGTDLERSDIVANEVQQEVRPEHWNVLTREEISNLGADGAHPAETLMNVVALIAKRFRTDVCSACLMEPDRANLVLAATVGLRRECVGNLRMAVNEGLTGLVAEQLQPVAVSHVKNHPRFKYFKEAGEEAYQSFLGVPLIDRGVLQGVLVVQTIEARVFGEDDIRMLSEAATQLARSSAKPARWTALSRPCRNACGNWRGTCGGAGTTTLPAYSSTWIRSAGTS